MADENAPMPKAEFSDAERSNNSSRKTKVAAISVTVTFLLGAVVSLVVVFSLEKATPNARLVEVNLKEGETLTYQVAKDIEVHVGEIQKGMFVLKHFYFCLNMYLLSLPREYDFYFSRPYRIPN